MSASTPAGGTVHVPHAELAWSMAGSGAVAVWCHGLGSSTHGQERAGLFDWAQLEAAHTLLRYDARGHGASSGRPVAADYRWESLADDLLVLLDSVVPDRRVWGIGSSMGSATLVYAALARPERFSGLVLTAPSTLHFTRPAQRSRYLALAAYRESHSHEEFLRAREELPVAPIFRGAERRLAWEVSPELTTAVLRGAALSDYPAPERLAQVECPVLVLAWASDVAHPLSAAGIVTDAIPGAALEIANTLDDVARWPARTAEFMRQHSDTLVPTQT